VSGTFYLGFNIYEHLNRLRCSYIG